MNIVFIASGGPPPPFLATAMACAKHFNPSSTVVQVGNTPSCEDRFFSNGEFTDECEAILGNAKNLGPNAYSFERKCIERWICLSGLIRRGDITVPLIQCDWDVLVVRDLNEVLSDWSEYDYTLADGMAAVEMLVFNRDVIPSYVEFLRDTYQRGLRPTVQNSANANDMTLFRDFSMLHGQFKRGETTQVRNGALFDYNMSCQGDIYEFENGHKKLYFGGHKVYVKRKDTQEMVRLNATHCHCRKGEMAGWFNQAKAE